MRYPSEIIYTVVNARRVGVEAVDYNALYSYLPLWVPVTVQFI